MTVNMAMNEKHGQYLKQDFWAVRDLGESVCLGICVETVVAHNRGGDSD